MSDNSRHQSRRRVVVTGLGCITPIGLNVQETWDNSLAGKSGIDKITQFDTSKLPVHIAGEVTGFNAENFIDKKELKRMDRFCQFAICSAEMALMDAGVDLDDEILKERTGVIVGAGMGGLPTIEATTLMAAERGPNRISPFFIPQCILNMAAGNISIKYGFQGPNYSVTSACASGCHSLGEATNYIRSGQCDMMITGGAESTVCMAGVGGFAAMKALSKRNDDPQAASRPWDKDRDGFVLAEGAAILILEEYEHAKKRNAKIYAEVCGYGVSSDAYHMTNPAPGGKGASLAMQHCLKDAQINVEQITYINAHGTSTPAGDLAETGAVKNVFKDHAHKVWMSSTKSMTGHALGAAGAIESIFTTMAVHTGKIPPTINLENPSEDCDLDYVPNTARETQVSYALNNSFGFGGTNACILFGKV